MKHRLFSLVPSLVPAIVSLSLVAACGGGSSQAMPDGGNGADAMPTGIIKGTVETASLAGNATPAQGVSVTVLGTATTAVTDSAGFFSLEAPLGITHLVASKAEHWSLIYTVFNTDGEDGGNDFEIIPNDVVAAVDAMLTSADFDPAKGFLMVDFDTSFQGGGEHASVPVTDGGFTFDMNGDLFEGDFVQAGGDHFVAFYNIAPGTSTVTVGGASGVNDCATDVSGVTDWPIQAFTFTLVNVTCTPL